MRAEKASAEDAEKEIETLKAANEEARTDAVDLLKELGFDVMPLLSADAFQDPPSFADPLVVSAMCRQA